MGRFIPSPGLLGGPPHPGVTPKVIARGLTWSGRQDPVPDHAGLFDMRGFAYSSDIPAFAEGQNGGLTSADPVADERFNPAAYVKDWKTPMLVIHGARDYRFPLDQGIGAYTGNQRLGVPAQYLQFPDENHWVLKPQNSVRWHATVEAWTAKNTK